MKRILALVISAVFLLRFTQASWQEIYSDDPRVTCSPKNATGLNACCCDDTQCGNNGWEQPCGGDLASTCGASQLIGPGGQGDHFTYTLHDLGSCGSPDCDLEQWSYNWTCCDAPVLGNWVPYHSNDNNTYCPMAAFYIGCSEPNEILIDNNETCVNTTCPGLKPLSSSYLTGYQAVVASAFVPAANGLIACAKALGGKTKLNVVSTSRCGTKGFTTYQVGMAMDTNLVLPDGTACDRTCMAQGYCAFHQSNSTCANSNNCPSCQGQPQNQQNTWVNSFLQCAGTVKGLQVGAVAGNGGNWNHFELPVKNQAATLNKYVPQLKAYCFSRCPGVTKGKVGSDMCKCPGFH